MELPRLRLRRVFEHGPSFKVQRAGMPALTIAKKALSPNLQAKLRKYAEGGDVAPEEQPTEDQQRDALISQALARQEQRFADENKLAEDRISATLARQEQQFADQNAAVDERISSVLERQRQKFSDETQQADQRVSDVLARQAKELSEQRQRESAVLARQASEFSEDAVTKALNEFRSSAMGEADARKFRDTLKSLPLDEKLKDKAFALGQVARRERASSMQQGADVEAVEDLASKALDQYRKSGKTAQDLTALLAAARALPQSDRARLFSLAKAARQVEPPAAVEAEPAAPVAAPAAAAELMGLPAPAGVPAAAPAMVAAAPAVPAAPVAPAKPAAREIKIPDAIKGTTPADFEAAIKANPQADLAAVATALVTAKAPQITPPNFDQITAAAPAGGGKTAIEKFDAAVAAKAAALTEEAKADFETKQEMVRIAQASEARQLAAANKSADMDAVFKGRREALARAFGTDEKGRPLPIEESLARGFQAKSMWGRMSTPQKIGSLISLAVGGFLSGYTDTKNYVYEAFNNLLENDLDAQKSNYNSLVKQYERLLGDEAAARKLAAADLLDLTALQAKSVEARSNLRGIGPQLAAVRADLEMKAAANREEVRKKMFDAEIAEINADTQRGLREAEEKAKLAKSAPKVAKTKPGAPTVAPGASALDAFNAITDAKQRGRYIVRTKDPLTKEVVEFPVAERQQRFVQDELDRRQGGLEKIRRVRTILAKRPSVIKGEELGQLQAAISDFWANFPDAEGKNRILPLADKDLIMNATLETGIPFVKFADLAGKTSAAMKEFERSTVEGIKNKIEGAGLVGHPGKDQLVSAYDAFLRGETRPRTPAPSPEKTGEGEGTKPKYMKMRAPQGFKNKAGKDLSGQVLGIPMDQVAGARSAGFVEVP